MHVSTTSNAGELARDRAVADSRRHMVAQRHQDYTAEEHEVWREALSRNTWVLSAWEGRLHPSYVEGIRALELPNRVPQLDALNESLKPTGWQVACVNGYIPSSTYAALMATRTFPMSRRIRRQEHIDYSPEPDLVHDVIGHLPMLFSVEHRTFLQKLATVMQSATTNQLDEDLYAANRWLGEVSRRSTSSAEDIATANANVVRLHCALQANASELTQLARMYLWSVEFGLMGPRDSFGIYGAALTSSPIEISAVCEGRAVILPYSVDVVRTDIAFTDLQAQYFVARDYPHLEHVLQQFESKMGARGDKNA